MIHDNSIIERNPDILSSLIDHEVIMMSILTGEYHGANEVGTQIWNIIEEPTPVNKLYDKLLETYEVEKEVCQQATQRFLNTLLEKELILIKN